MAAPALAPPLLRWPQGHAGACRFAPTPSGALHLGNARTALLSWLAARSTARRAILRVEDLDPRATPPGCIETQLADLHWLGLTWDEGPQQGGPFAPYQQSLRGALYHEALEALNRLGLLYPCSCSRREVLAANLAPHIGEEGPIYPGTHRPDAPRPLPTLHTPAPECGRRPALRLNTQAALAHLGWTHVAFEDLWQGPQRFDAQSLDDFVLRRADGIAAYQLACALDDALMGCDLVVRGADLLSSAARQILLLALLGLAAPRYAHAGLLTDAQGRRLSKRDADTALHQLRTAGVPRAEVVRLLARSCGLPAMGSVEALREAFDLTGDYGADVALPEAPWPQTAR